MQLLSLWQVLQRLGEVCCCSLRPKRGQELLHKLRRRLMSKCVKELELGTCCWQHRGCLQKFLQDTNSYTQPRLIARSALAEVKMQDT